MVGHPPGGHGSRETRVRRRGDGEPETPEHVRADLQYLAEITRRRPHNHRRDTTRAEVGEQPDTHHQPWPEDDPARYRLTHLRENGRICVMFASFDHRTRIVRLHGRGKVALPGAAAYDEVISRHRAHPSTRAVIVVDVERVSDSCGHGVPVMQIVEERDLLRLTAEKKGPERMDAYRADNNATSIDGLPGL